MSERAIENVTSIYEQPWWFDAVAPGSWSEATAKSEGRTAARLPLERVRFGPVTMLRNPVLTPRVGPWIEELGSGYREGISRRHALLADLIDDLPRHDLARFRLSHTLDDWLPFHWTGFTSTLRYTLRIDGGSDIGAGRRGLDPEVRERVEAERARLVVRETSDSSALPRVLGLRRSSGVARALPRLHAAAEARGQGQILAAADGDQIRAMSLAVWDESALYLLVLAPQSRTGEKAGLALLVWSWIERANQRGLAVQFEASVPGPAERFLRGFGARPVRHLIVERASDRIAALRAAREAALASARLARAPFAVEAAPGPGRRKQAFLARRAQP